MFLRNPDAEIEKMYDTIIIGGGIAGMTSAIYAARKRMKFEIIATEVGGQFMTSGEILNYPGIVKTTGVEFSSTMQEQLKFNDVNIRNENVTEVKKNADNFIVKTDKESYDTRSVIIATGARPRKLNIPGEKEFEKRGVVYCSICDGPLFSGKEVAIVGSGNSALEAVDFMKDIASKIYLVVRSNRLNAHEYLIEGVVDNPKVEIIYNANSKEILGDQMVNALVYEQGGKEKKIDVSGVIIEAGRVPNTEIFKDLIDLEESGHIKIDCHTRTSVSGIFSAGDCTSGQEYQYVIAAGQGCMALIKAAKYLALKKDKG